MVDQQGTETGSANQAATRPMTGEEYVESLRDGREIYLYGERVKDVTAHPAFHNPVRMTARLYDALHDPKHQRRPDLSGRRRRRRLHAPVLHHAAVAPRTWSPTRRRSRRGPG